MGIEKELASEELAMRKRQNEFYALCSKRGDPTHYSEPVEGVLVAYWEHAGRPTLNRVLDEGTYCRVRGDVWLPYEATLRIVRARNRAKAYGQALMDQARKLKPRSVKSETKQTADLDLAARLINSPYPNS